MQDEAIVLLWLIHEKKVNLQRLSSFEWRN